MKNRRQLAFAILMALSLFSGRSLLWRALHSESDRAARPRRVERVALDPAVPQRLALDLSEAAGSVAPDLSGELVRASWACARIADALESGRPLAASAAREVVARAHEGLGRAHVVRAARSYADGDRLGAASDLRVAVRELDLAAALQGAEEPEQRIREVLDVARRFEEGGTVTDQDFGGSVDVLGRALHSVSPGAAHAALTSSPAARSS